MSRGYYTGNGGFFFAEQSTNASMKNHYTNPQPTGPSQLYDSQTPQRHRVEDTLVQLSSQHRAAQEKASQLAEQHKKAQSSWFKSTQQKAPQLAIQHREAQQNAQFLATQHQAAQTEWSKFATS
jgi:uncharacterized protein (DUF3084 family)